MERQIRCLMQACDKLELSYCFFDQEQNLLQVETDPPLLFEINKTPFNTEVMGNICRDKMHSYQVLNQRLRMPKTVSFLDYQTRDEYKHYLAFSTQAAILDHIEVEFTYPVVVKMNRGALGVNVFLCHNRVEAAEALTAIFNRNSMDYDYIALAQEYIPAVAEYRVVYFRGEALLAYDRVSGNAEFGAKYWETLGGAAELIHDETVIPTITEQFKAALNLPGLEFVGLDVIKSQTGEWVLIELNSAPKFNHYAQMHGDDVVVRMYQQILKRYLEA